MAEPTLTQVPANLVRLRSVTKTTTYTMAVTDTFVKCDTETTGAFTLTLPPAADAFQDTVYWIQLVDGTSNNKLTIDGNSTETITTKSETAQTVGMWITGDMLGIYSDGSNWIYAYDGLIPHQAEMTRDAAQSISNNTETAIAFDNEVYDNAGIADQVTNDRFDILRAGKYLVTGFTAVLVNDTEWNSTRIAVNSTTVRWVFDYASGNQNIYPLVSSVISLSAGDTVELKIQHNQGGAQNTLTGEATKPRMSVVEIR